MAQPTVTRVDASVTPWSGRQELRGDDAAVSQPSDGSTPPDGSGPSDTLHVAVRLTAMTADGRLVQSDRNDLGISVARGEHDNQLSPQASQQVEDSINQALGRDPKLRRPSRLAWTGLIDALARADIVVTEQELIDAPLKIDFSPG
jgi:hypothetical protein